MEVFYGLTYIPPKKDKVLTPSTSECKLTWKKVLYIGKDKVKMRGIRWVLHQDPHPRETWRQRDTQVQDSHVTGAKEFHGVLANIRSQKRH